MQLFTSLSQNKSGVLSDQQLIENSKNGDARQFELLVSRYRNTVFRYLLKSIGDPEKAEDLTQDTFLSAYENLRSFQGNSKFSTWLIGIALNKVRNYINRSPEKRYKMVSDEVLFSHKHQGDGPDTMIEKNQKINALAQGIDELPKDLREVLVLVTLEGLSYEDAASLMKIPLGTVKSKLFRARDQLRAHLIEKKLA